MVISPTASWIQWCMQMYAWWFNADLSCLGRMIYARPGSMVLGSKYILSLEMDLCSLIALSISALKIISTVINFKKPAPWNFRCWWPYTCSYQYSERIIISFYYTTVIEYYYNIYLNVFAYNCPVEIAFKAVFLIPLQTVSLRPRILDCQSYWDVWPVMMIVTEEYRQSGSSRILCCCQKVLRYNMCHFWAGFLKNS